MINLVALPCLCVDVFDGTFNMSLADKGSVTYNNGKIYYVPAKDVKVIVDTTGCGDSYHAGFVCSHMMNEDIYNDGGGYILVGVEEKNGVAVRPVKGVPVERIDEI